MPGSKEKKKMTGRNFALTIILGIFVAIMVISLFNLVVSYVYEPPKYENFCKNTGFGPYPVKYGLDNGQCANCTFSKSLQEQVDNCSMSGGNPVYDYNSQGCTSSLKQCDMCNIDYNHASDVYNRNTFYIFAVLGFVLIVLGLFVGILLIQIITLPAGAFLVIEAAIKNFDSKLFVIITFSLLIIAAVYLALKKLR